MWTNAVGWASSLIVLLLLGSEWRARQGNGSVVSETFLGLGRTAAVVGFLAYGFAMGGSALMAITALLGVNAAATIRFAREQRKWRQLTAANDDVPHGELKLRVLSNVLDIRDGSPLRR